MAHQPGLVAQDLARGGVPQGPGLTHQLEIPSSLQIAPHVGHVPGGHERTSVDRGHDARSALDLPSLQHSGLGDERRDQVGRHGGDGHVVHRTAAHPRQELDGDGLRLGTCRCRRHGLRRRRRGRHLQGGPVRPLGQHQHLPRVQPVRIAHLLQVHAPEFSPAPRAFQEQLRQPPQGVTRAHGVGGGGVGRQVGQGHPLASHPLRDLELGRVHTGGRRHRLRPARGGQEGKRQNGPGPGVTRSREADKWQATKVGQRGLPWAGGTLAGVPAS